MPHPKTLESSVQQFYQSNDDDKDSNIIMECCVTDTPPVRPESAGIDEVARMEEKIKSTQLTESIRNELDVYATDDNFGSFFQDLSGWEINQSKKASLNDESSLNYLNYNDKKDDFTNQSIKSQKKIKSRRAMVIRELLTRTISRPSSIGYRLKSDWGSEEDGNFKPYALSKSDEVNNGIYEVDADDEEMVKQEGIIDPPITEARPSKVTKWKDLDQDDTKLLEASGDLTKPKNRRPSSMNNPVRGTLSGSESPNNRMKSLRTEGREKKSDFILISGQKYHSDSHHNQYPERPLTAARNIIPSASLPKIGNQNVKTNISSAQRKVYGMEIPKWYPANNSESSRNSRDKNLARFMEIMGSKSSLRSPRKLSANGFLSLPMPNQPPETRGFVFDKKPRILSTLIDEMIKKDQSLQVKVLKPPILNPNQRSFAEEVHLNREGKSEIKRKQ